MDPFFSGTFNDLWQLDLPSSPACPPPPGSPALAEIAQYNGPTAVSARPGSSDEVHILLAASIHDICADPADPPAPAALRDVRVNFIDPASGQPLNPEPLPVQLLDSLSGTVAYPWSVDPDSDAPRTLTVGIELLNYYGQDLLARTITIELKRPGRERVSGRGTLTHAASAGRLAGDPGSPLKFGVSARFNPYGSGIWGAAYLQFLHTGDDGRRRRYRVYTPGLEALSIDAGARTAVFAGPARVLDLTRRFFPTWVEDEATLLVELEDNGKPGTGDRIAFSLYDAAGALLYASHWDGRGPSPQYLDRGDLRIQGRGYALSFREEGEAPDDGAAPASLSELRLYPVPASTELTVELKAPADGEALYRVFDLSGRLLLQNQVDLFRGANQLNLPVGQLPEGTYLLQVRAGEMEQARQFTVRR